MAWENQKSDKLKCYKRGKKQQKEDLLLVNTKRKMLNKENVVLFL